MRHRPPSTNIKLQSNRTFFLRTHLLGQLHNVDGNQWEDSVQVYDLRAWCADRRGLLVKFPGGWTAAEFRTATGLEL